MLTRPYDAAKDFEAVRRIWLEAGWIKEDEDKGLSLFIDGIESRVAEVDGQAECHVSTTAGTMRYLGRDLPVSIVATVLTSYLARKQGIAGRLTARAVAEDAAGKGGAMVSLLGIFDQGYYDRLGYGTGPYGRSSTFDPASLKVEIGRRAPTRLTKDDWESIHECRLRRHRRHGGVCIAHPSFTRSSMEWFPRFFGLGFCDGPDGALSHHVCLGIPGDAENGPYIVAWMAYETNEQLLELLGVLKSLGDQIHGIRMADPPGVQMQALIDQPFRRERLTAKGTFDANPTSHAGWQARICDLPGCIAATRLLGVAGEPVRFNLSLRDPIERSLPDDAPWRGVGGKYVVSFGQESNAERGRDASLPTLTASVGAFTRLWLGVGPATGLVVTDELAGPSGLLEELDRALHLPLPSVDWSF